MIIDIGLCENIISRDVVEKLNLKIEKHHKASQIAQFNKGNEVIVSKLCLVNFPVCNKYMYSIWCDVAWMLATA